MVPFGIVTCCIYGHIPKIQGILAISLACFAGHLSQNLDVVLENGMEFRENIQQSSTINSSNHQQSQFLLRQGDSPWILRRLFLMILASLLSKFWIPLDDRHPWYSWDLHGPTKAEKSWRDTTRRQSWFFQEKIL
jgi:hypothetical protein